MHPLAAPFRFEGDRPESVLLLHGWTGSPAHMRDLGQRLNDAGYTVVGPLLAGHGTTLDDMATTGWRDWLGSAAEPAMDILEGGDTLHLVGLSMGGIISLLLATSLDAASVTTINAPLLVRDRRSYLAGLYRGSKRIEHAEPPVAAPPEMRKYQQQYNGTPLGTAAELADLIRAARRSLSKVTCPALIIQSKTDETVRPKSATIIYDGLGSADKGIVWLECSRHVAVVDVEREAIAASILEHLRSAFDSRHAAV
jgi:carboxylesterase